MRSALKNFFTAGRLALFGLALLLFPLCASAGAQEQEEPEAQQQASPQNPALALNLMQRLSLTPEQRRQLREIRRQREPGQRDLARRLRLARRALDEAIYADAADEALVEQRARELAVLQNLLAHHRALTELQVRRVLTPEQLRLFRSLRQEAQRRQMLQRRMNRALRRRNQ
ncbi:MAG TPA: Spy/CpxP family protein refolding chaperone [Pyrinomonadaceae bacterium]|nr:Spy/CpxP family protein refolding chaperone [Pyrinomonadaceae bacterium]